VTRLLMAFHGDHAISGVLGVSVIFDIFILLRISSMTFLLNPKTL